MRSCGLSQLYDRPTDAVRPDRLAAFYRAICRPPGSDSAAAGSAGVRDDVDLEFHLAEAVRDRRAGGEGLGEVLAVQLVVFRQVGRVLDVAADLHDVTE